MACPLVAPDAEVFSFSVGLLAVLGGALGGLAIVVWWMFFSRAPWSERVGAIVLMIVAVVATKLIVHESIAAAGMGMLLYISSIPYLSLALVAWAVATRRLTDGARRVALVAAIVLACAPWTLVRTAGVGGAGSEFHWRWTPTPEQRLLAQAGDEPLDSARRRGRRRSRRLRRRQRVPRNRSAPKPAIRQRHFRRLRQQRRSNRPLQPQLRRQPGLP